MAQPVPFLFVATVLTLGLLALARQSADLLQSGGDSAAVTGAGRSSEHRTAVPGPPLDSATQSTQGQSVPGEATELGPRAGASPRRPQNLELTPAMVIANVAATQGLMAGVVVAAAVYYAIPFSALGVTGTPLSTGLLGVGVGAVFGVLLWLGNELATTLADAVGAAYDEGVREMLAPESSGGWVLLFGLVLPLIAVAEELLFRAALIGVPAAFFAVSPWPLAVVASLAFALGHGAQGRVGIVITGLLGFVLAAGYIVTGSLLVVVVAHYVVNGLEFLVREYLAVDI